MCGTTPGRVLGTGTVCVQQGPGGEQQILPWCLCSSRMKMRLFGSAFPVNPCTFAHVPLLEGSAERALQPGVCGCYQVSEMLFLNVYTYSDVSVAVIRPKGFFWLVRGTINKVGLQRSHGGGINTLGKQRCVNRVICVLITCSGYQLPLQIFFYSYIHWHVPIQWDYSLEKSLCFLTILQVHHL